MSTDAGIPQSATPQPSRPARESGIHIAGDEIAGAIRVVRAQRGPISPWPKGIAKPELLSLQPGPGIVVTVPGRGRIIAVSDRRGVSYWPKDGGGAPLGAVKAGIAALFGVAEDSGENDAIHAFLRDAAAYAAAVDKQLHRILSARAAQFIGPAVRQKAGLARPAGAAYGGRVET